MDTNMLQNTGRPPQMMGNAIPPNPPYANFPPASFRGMQMGVPQPMNFMAAAGVEKKK